jgi:hypothetical protein
VFIRVHPWPLIPCLSVFIRGLLFRVYPCSSVAFDSVFIRVHPWPLIPCSSVFIRGF